MRMSKYQIGIHILYVDAKIRAQVLISNFFKVSFVILSCFDLIAVIDIKRMIVVLTSCKTGYFGDPMVRCKKDPSSCTLGFLFGCD